MNELGLGINACTISDQTIFEQLTYYLTTSNIEALMQTFSVNVYLLRLHVAACPLQSLDAWQVLTLDPDLP